MVIPAIKMQRNDPIELRRRILAMSPAERKRLGINKSTLWYQKGKFAEGIKIELHRNTISKLT
jgi:CRISP-associated protein Cas1